MGLEFGETLFGFRATGGAATLALPVAPMPTVECCGLRTLSAVAFISASDALFARADRKDFVVPSLVTVECLWCINSDVHELSVTDMPLHEAEVWDLPERTSIWGELPLPSTSGLATGTTRLGFGLGVLFNVG